mmetsp:Transcript_19375/g.53208  ORF Transcript_19375/g.53208 Transcript_19375/m.53208 type:complete len:330 (-) Transcript_19375:259-1248(-)
MAPKRREATKDAPKEAAPKDSPKDSPTPKESSKDVKDAPPVLKRELAPPPTERQTRATTTVKKQKIDSIPEGILDLLECPVCHETPIPKPIMQCRNGHFVCKKHLPELDSCPVCKVAPPWARSTGMERMAEQVEVVCGNSKACGARMKCCEVSKHQEICEFRPIKCPAFISNPCPRDAPPLAMDPPAIVEHLVKAHKASQGDAPNGVVRPRFVWRTGSTWPLHCVYTLGCHFLLCAKADPAGNFLACVQMVGTPATAAGYVAELSWEWNNWRVCHHGPTLPVAESPIEVFSSGTCLMLSSGLLRRAYGRLPTSDKPIEFVLTCSFKKAE